MNELSIYRSDSLFKTSLTFKLKVMAKYTKGLNGPVSGKVGTIVGSKWRDIHYLRSLPKPSRRGPSLAQIIHRAKFSMVVKFLRPITDILNLGYNDLSQGKLTGYNLAFRSTFADAVIGQYPDFKIDFPNFKISKGTLTPLLEMNFEMSDHGKVIFSWKATRNNYNSFLDDMVLLLVYNETKDMFLIYDEAVRNDASFILEILMTHTDDVLHFWAFAMKRDRKVTSNSQYLGELTV